MWPLLLVGAVVAAFVFLRKPAGPAGSPAGRPWVLQPSMTLQPGSYFFLIHDPTPDWSGALYQEIRAGLVDAGFDFNDLNDPKKTAPLPPPVPPGSKQVQWQGHYKGPAPFQFQDLPPNAKLYIVV